MIRFRNFPLLPQPTNSIAAKIAATAFSAAALTISAGCGGGANVGNSGGTDNGTPAPVAAVCTGSNIVQKSEGSGCISIASSQGQVVNAQSLPQPAAAPSELSVGGTKIPAAYTQGFYTFSVENITPVGSSVTVTIHTPAGTNPIAYLKCNKTQSSCAPFENASITGNKIVLTLQDGGAGDEDGVADGAILDPGAPVFAQPNASAPLDQAKALVQNIRTTVQTETLLQSPETAFTNQVQVTELVTQAQSASLLSTFQNLLDYTVQSVLPGLQTTCVLYPGYSGSGTYFTYDSNGNPQWATLSVSCGSVLTGSVTRIQFVGHVVDETVNLTIALTNDASYNIIETITPGSTIVTTGTGPGLSLTIASGTETFLVNPRGGYSSGSASTVATLSQQYLPNGDTPLSFTGALSFDSVQCTAASCAARLSTGNATFTPSNIDLDGTFSQGSSTIPAKLTATLTDPAAFDPQMPISNGNVPAGTAELAVSESNVSNVLPTTVDVTVNLTNFYQSASTSDSAPIGTATLSFMQSGVKILDGTVTTSAPASGSGSTDYSAAFTDDNGAVLTLTNPLSGATSGDIGQATVGGTVVGTVSKTIGGEVIITYSDGTFVSIFN